MINEFVLHLFNMLLKSQESRCESQESRCKNQDARIKIKIENSLYNMQSMNPAISLVLGSWFLPPGS
jgi:hypothetical protein